MFRQAGQVHCGLDGACLTKDRLAMLGSIGIRNGRLVFFPCALKRPFLAGQESLSFGRPPLRFGLSGAGRSSPVLSTAIEAAVGAARTTEKEYDIGNHRLIHRFR